LIRCVVAVTVAITRILGETGADRQARDQCGNQQDSDPAETNLRIEHR